MVSLIADYEQQYAVLSAEITADIGKLGRSDAGNLPSSYNYHTTRTPNNMVHAFQTRKDTSPRR